jgi:hypothetical protein
MAVEDWAVLLRYEMEGIVGVALEGWTVEVTAIL